MYKDFAAVYDRLMQDVDYDAWAAFYREILREAGVVPGAAIAETACGTGSFSLRLAPMYRLIPSDLSEDMLSRAAAKARESGLSIPFIRQDMRFLQVHHPVDAVMCACDGVNYLLDGKDLRRFFSSSFQALKPGGAIAFDVSSACKLEKVLGSAARGLREEDICYLWINDWQSRSCRLRMRLSVFVRREDGAWDLLEEDQVQRAWETEEIVKVLEETGFENVKVYGDRVFRKARATDLRIHFTANKQKETA